MANLIDRDALLELLQTSVAIADGFYNDKEKHQLFYDLYKDQLSGFPGIWKWVAETALLFHEVEQELKPDWGVTHEWIESIDSFMGRIEHHACNQQRPELPTSEQIRTMAREAMENNRINHGTS